MNDTQTIDAAAFLHWLRAESEFWATLRLKPGNTLTAEEWINSIGSVILAKMETIQP